MPRAATSSNTSTRNTRNTKQWSPNRSPKRSPKWSSALTGAALLATTLGATVAPAQAAESAGSGKYVSLGDSYAAGAGIPASSAGLCLRSDHNYGHLVAAALASSSYVDTTCAGAKVGALTTPQKDVGIVVNGPQLDAVTPDTSLITLTIGGDNLGTSDIGFGDLAVVCSALSLTNPFGAPCRNHYGDTLSNRMDSATTELSAALQKLHAKAPKARVLILGYPSVLPEDPKKCFGKMPVTTGDLAFLHSVLGELNTKIAKTATAAGATYVDTLTPTKGHDSCSSDPWIEGLLPGSPTLPLHPNATGERVMSDAVLNALRH
ncbi:SGNH/GDSL hydrolase family protein [Streptomyces gilvosporeus]|uniref:SGNH/GDSL hydrolase family protein n=1 Tax=Streptomyces gilvosporeus TaxID=553510 RepID=UPI001F197B6F|nr:SGNH/GDSL hydrolase family protein [Streptomyces gilvosporeus]